MKSLSPSFPLLQDAANRTRGVWQGLEAVPTLVIAQFSEIDCYGAGVMAAIPRELCRIVGVFLHVFDIPDAGSAATVKSSYASAEKDARQAFIVNVFNDDIARLRALIFQASDNGIPLERCYIIAPHMTDELYQAICDEFGHRFDNRGITIEPQQKVHAWVSTHAHHQMAKGIPRTVVRLMGMPMEDGIE